MCGCGQPAEPGLSLCPRCVRNHEALLQALCGGKRRQEPTVAVPRDLIEAIVYDHGQGLTIEDETVKVLADLLEVPRG